MCCENITIQGRGVIGWASLRYYGDKSVSLSSLTYDGSKQWVFWAIGFLAAEQSELQCSSAPAFPSSFTLYLLVSKESSEREMSNKLYEIVDPPASFKSDAWKSRMRKEKR